MGSVGRDWVEGAWLNCVITSTVLNRQNWFGLYRCVLWSKLTHGWSVRFILCNSVEP